MQSGSYPGREVAQLCYAKQAQNLGGDSNSSFGYNHNNTWWQLGNLAQADVYFNRKPKDTDTMIRSTVSQWVCCRCCIHRHRRRHGRRSRGRLNSSAKAYMQMYIL